MVFSILVIVVSAGCGFGLIVGARFGWEFYDVVDDVLERGVRRVFERLRDR